MPIDMPFSPDSAVETDPQRSWAIYVCPHGCLHVEIDRVTLTLTTDEFHALQALMRRACERFHRSGAPDAAAPTHTN